MKALKLRKNIFNWYFSHKCKKQYLVDIIISVSFRVGLVICHQSSSALSGPQSYIIATVKVNFNSNYLNITSR